MTFFCETDKKHIFICLGGSSGIGRAVSLDLAQRGAKVIIASSSVVKGNAAVQEIQSLTNNRAVYYHQLNLSDSNSIREFAAHIYKTEQRIDILINNAAISHHPSSTTAEGYEAIFGTNYLGHFLLTYLLIDLMKKSGGGRIVNVTSLSHSFVVNPIDFTVSESKFGAMLYPNLEGYEISKLALVIHAKELARRYADYNIQANSCHPGLVLTNLWLSTRKSFGRIIFFIVKLFMRPLFVEASDAAFPIIHTTLCEDMDHVTGKYIKNCRPTRESRHAQDPDVGEKLWDVSLFMSGITPGMTLQENLEKRYNPEMNTKTTNDSQWWEMPGVTEKESDPNQKLIITRD